MDRGPIQLMAICRRNSLGNDKNNPIIMKRLIHSILGVLLASAVSGSAVTISRDFDLAYTTGPLAGQTFAGSLSYDDANLTGVGFELLGPAGGVQPAGFLTFQVIVDGINFTLADDYLFPNYPQLSFHNGAFNGLDYIGANGPATLFVTGDATFYLNPDESDGTITLRTPSVPDSGSSALLMAVAVLGLVWLKRNCVLA